MKGYVCGGEVFIILSTPLIFLALDWMNCLVCIQSDSQSVSLWLHTDMEQHHHHPVHADHHHPHKVTAEPHPQSLSSDSIILVIFLLACFALGLGIKLMVVLLRRFRWVFTEHQQAMSGLLLFFTGRGLRLWSLRGNTLQSLENGRSGTGVTTDWNCTIHFKNRISI